MAHEGHGDGTGEGVVREVELPADPADVWEALTEPDRVATWFGAPVRWDLRPGGDVEVGPGDGGGEARAGEVDEVVAGRRLRFRWWPTGDDGGTEGSSVVTYELEPTPAGTRLVVTEVRLEAGAPVALASATARWSAWDGRLLGLWVGAAAGLAARA
jgi:uncharacterized protein YndB with AHSA1/START domain